MFRRGCRDHQCFYATPLHHCVTWLIIFGFTSHSRIFHLYGDVTIAKFRPMLGTQGLWVGRDLYRATPAVTRDLGFSGLIRRSAPFNRLLRHTRGCGGSILSGILTLRHMDDKGLIDYLPFYVPHKNISLTWRRHHCRWRAKKKSGLCSALRVFEPAVTRGPGFSALIRRTAPFSRLVRHTIRGCGGPILTRILTGWELLEERFPFRATLAMTKDLGLYSRI
jgi:hypothetical protein